MFDTLECCCQTFFLPPHYLFCETLTHPPLLLPSLLLQLEAVSPFLQIIYVAPMKALAAEMVRNFGSRLEALGVRVRELTGDMQLTKAEIQRTQVSGLG